MTLHKQNEIKDILKKSGWEENRNISNKIKNTTYINCILK